MGLKEDISTIKGVSDGLTANKVSQFAYDSTAYENNMVEGEDTYNINDHNCIPKPSLTILKINATVRDKGWRARASSLTRMLINHMLGRTSYNLNKVNDLFNTLLLKLYNFIGSANGLATLDANGRIPYSQLPESAVEIKGYWNASTNTPQLADGTGDNGDEYYVDTAGTQDLGSGSQYFSVGDRVLYLNGVWKNINATSVKKVCNVVPNAEGNVTLAKGDVGLGNVANVGSSATPSEGGTDNFTTGGAYSALANKVDKTTKVNGHALSGDVTVTKSDVGLGNVANVGSSDTPVENGTDNFTTGGAYRLQAGSTPYPFRATLELPRGVDPATGVVSASLWGFIETDPDENTIGKILELNAFITVLKSALLPPPTVVPTENFAYAFCAPSGDDRYQYIRWAYADDPDLANKLISGGGNQLEVLPSGFGNWWGIVDLFGKHSTDILVWFTMPTLRGENRIRQ